MCRHLAYLGQPLPLSRLLYDPPHSLERQSYAARELLEGRVAADGFGVAWYPPAAAPGATGAVAGDPAEPLCYRTDRPVWADATARALAERLTGRIVLANVRNATDPTTLGVVNVHPFTTGRWAFTHNGFLAGFRTNFLAALRATLSPARHAMVSGATDTETLFLLLLDRLDEEPRAETALRSVVQTAMARAEAAGVVAHLNLLLSDGESVWATRAGTGGRSNSLYVAHGHPGFPGDVVASEPLDGHAAWRSVPHGGLVRLAAGHAPRIEPIDA